MPPPPDYFHLVDQIRGEEKYFDIAIGEIERSLEAPTKQYKVECLHDLTDLGEQGREVTLCLHVRCSDGCLAWTAALIMHGIRIDGVDWEPGIGWHRHGWDPNQQHAENKKARVLGFESVATRREFIERLMSEMKIRFNKYDDGTPKLF